MGGAAYGSFEKSRKTTPLSADIPGKIGPSLTSRTISRRDAKTFNRQLHPYFRNRNRGELCPRCFCSLEKAGRWKRVNMGRTGVRKGGDQTEQDCINHSSDTHS